MSIKSEVQLDPCKHDAVKKEPHNVHVKNEPVHLAQRAFDLKFNLNDDDYDE